MQTPAQTQAEDENYQEPVEAPSSPVAPATPPDDRQDLLGADVLYTPPAGSRKPPNGRYRIIATCTKRYLDGPTLVRVLLEPCAPMPPIPPHPKGDQPPFWAWASEVRQKEEETP